MALYRRRIAAEDWKPVGVDALEAAAFRVARSTDNRSVIAGPGAGKTELLAPRLKAILAKLDPPDPRRRRCRRPYTRRAQHGACEEAAAVGTLPSVNHRAPTSKHCSNVVHSTARPEQHARHN
jgi:hypothetical protein